MKIFNIALLICLAPTVCSTRIIATYSIVDGVTGADNITMLSDQLTVECWVTPGNITQGGPEFGPTRIVSFSVSTDYQCFMIGQDYGTYHFRLHTIGTDLKAMPRLISSNGVAKQEQQHIVITISKDGLRTMYVNSVQILQDIVYGDFSVWDSECKFIIGNEHDGKRLYVGDIFSVNIHDVALTGKQVMELYKRGLLVLPAPTRLRVR